MLAFLVFRFGCRSLVCFRLRRFTVLVHQALVLVAEFQQREELTTPTNLEVLAYEVEVLGRGNFWEGFGFRALINVKLKWLASSRKLTLLYVERN